MGLLYSKTTVIYSSIPSFIIINLAHFFISHYFKQILGYHFSYNIDFKMWANNNVMYSYLPFILAVPFLFFFVALIVFKGPVQQKQLKVKLVEKKRITHDSIIFTFLLPNQKKPLGLKIGEHIEIQYETVYLGKILKVN